MAAQEHLYKIFVGGLHYETREESLSQYFSSYGEVSECIVKINPETNKSRGFGFVTFNDPEPPAVVDSVQSSRPHKIDGKDVDTKRIVPKGPKNVIGDPNAHVKVDKLFIGGLKEQIGEEDMRTYFAQFGAVEDVKTFTDPQSGKRKGFAFVRFSDFDCADKCYLKACENPERKVVINGVHVEIKKAVEHKKNPGANQQGGFGFNNMGNQQRFNNTGNFNQGNQGSYGQGNYNQGNVGMNNMGMGGANNMGNNTSNNMGNMGGMGSNMNNMGASNMGMNNMGGMNANSGGMGNLQGNNMMGNNMGMNQGASNMMSNQGQAGGMVNNQGSMVGMTSNQANMGGMAANQGTVDTTNQMGNVDNSYTGQGQYASQGQYQTNAGNTAVGYGQQAGGGDNWSGTQNSVENTQGGYNQSGNIQGKARGFQNTARQQSMPYNTIDGKLRSSLDTNAIKEKIGLQSSLE